jgi:AraC-like DNA-binding protein
MSPLYALPVMAVSARSDSFLPQSDKSGMVDMRTGGRPRAGTFAYEGAELATGWHSHDLHQIEYALQGVVEVETASGHYLLPPQQAAWIPAGLVHQTTIATSVRTASVFFDPALVPQAGQRARILGVAPVVREMIIYGLRWPIERAGSDIEADAFFAVLGRLVADALDDEAPLSLPFSAEPVVAAALAFTNAHLDSVRIGAVSRAVGVSERTLRRQFGSELSISWRTYLLQARLLRSMALLAESGPTVLQVANGVGFESASAFARAFLSHTGETPSAYRHRVRGGVNQGAKEPASGS